MDPHPPNPQGVPASNLQHSYTKRNPLPPPLTPNPQGVPPTNLQHSCTNKGTPTPYPQPTGSTSHQLTTLIHQKGPHPLPPTHREYHPPSYNTHTLKGPPAPTPTPNHRMYHPPSYNTHTLKGPTDPHPYPQPTGSTTHQLTSYTKGIPYPHPLPSTHREYHPPSY